MTEAIRNYLIGALVLVALALVAFIIFVYSGTYYIGADRPHTKPVLAIMEALREHSIDAHAEDVTVPGDLDDPQRVLEGAGHYDSMCTGCHLKPGQDDSEMRKGLYPQPPALPSTHVEPKQAFWVIKHGIKMSAMPAWGATHDDAKLWNIVAFLQKLPTMTPADYQDLVARAPADEDDVDEGHATSGGGSMPGEASSAPTGTASAAAPAVAATRGGP